MNRPLSEVVHALALRAYPRRFRDRLGDDLQSTYTRRIAAARTSGRTRAFAAATAGCLDTLASGLAERAAYRRLRKHHARVAPTTRTQTMTLESIAADTRLAFRQIRRAPLFAAMIVATLAVGIGANSAIFSTVYAVLLKPLPYNAPDRLVAIWSDATKLGDGNYPVSPANFEAFAGENTALSQVEGMYSFLINLQVPIGASSETLQAASVTPGMFRLLGQQALWGRGLQEGDDEAVVLSHHYWQRRFGSDPGVIGQFLPGPPGVPARTIVGVMPASFVFPYRSMLGPSGFSRAQTADVWVPLLPRSPASRMLDASGQPSRTIHMLSVIGRLKPGMTLEAARLDLQQIADRRAKQMPDTNEGFGVTVRSLLEQTVGSVRPALILLSTGVAVLLLLTCVNVANVLLARATGRQRDAAVRAALGASRARLLQQALVESALLSVMGGAAALGIVAAGTRLLLTLAPADLPRIAETQLSPLVVAFTFATAMFAGLATGLLPAWASSRAKAEHGLRESTRTTAGRAQRAARSALVVAEVTLATLLTVGAGLLLRSFVSVLNVDPGFSADHLLTFQVSAPPQYSNNAGLIRYYDELRDKLMAVPGVTHVGGSTRIPLGSTMVSTQLSVEGRDIPPTEKPEVQMRRSVHDYFGTMKIPVLEGRVFTDADRSAGEALTVVNAALASSVFPGGSAIGRRVQMGPNPTPNAWMRIIGVVGNVKHGSLEEEPKPEIYISQLQGPPGVPFMAVRTAGDPEAATSAVIAAVNSFGGNPASNVRTMEALRHESVGERRFVMWLTGSFGVVALLLAVVGIYGVIALLVSERTSEVGIRLALGASPGQVWSMLVSHAATLSVYGVVIGLGLAVVLAPLASRLLFGVSPTDPLTFAGVGFLLLVMAVVAAAVPARRAMGVDPAVALRNG
ncbi:MAG: ABC transporter permease [Acidobacteria bacterium]|nr:ABC transporter permease [Acidobacteriota bacterium]